MYNYIDLWVWKLCTVVYCIFDVILIGSVHVALNRHAKMNSVIVMRNCVTS